MAGTYVEGKHDLGLLRQDGSIKWGFYLATDPRTKQPLFRSYYDDFLSTRIYNGDPGYNQLTPEKEFSIRQDSWEMGFANEFYNPNTPKKYFLIQLRPAIQWHGYCGTVTRFHNNSSC